MANILVVDDSKFFSSLLKKNIEQRLGFHVTSVETYAEAVAIIDERGDEFLVCLLDLTLPDAMNGEIVDYAVGKEMPVVVFTSNFSDELRESMLAKNVIDYVIKDNSSSLEYLLNLFRRLHRNNWMKALVVDDSATARSHIAKLLDMQMLRVIEVENGAEALVALAENPDIKIVITDFNMPNMDGAELIQKIRRKYTKDKLVIIGMSTYGNNVLSAKFIKNGANDFIHKPFLPEEFLCRVSQNLDVLEHVNALKDNLEKDYLTGLDSRRRLFDAGEVLFANASRGSISLSAAMIDIDYFKTVNDRFGHKIGDDVIKQVADLLSIHFRRESDVVARFGGEEFCILAVNASVENLRNTFENLRRDIDRQVFIVDETHVGITVSIGVSNRISGSLDSLIKAADSALYEAKNSGRNQVVFNLVENNESDKAAATL